MYPTKKQILQKPFPLDPIVLAVAAIWKLGYLKKLAAKDQKQRLKEIQLLLDLLAAKLTPARSPRIALGETYCYHPASQTIYLDKTHASVISALHELGHHAYGPSELKACRFSVWLFKTIFPEFYEKLTWVGHLLVKNPKTMKNAP